MADVGNVIGRFESALEPLALVHDGIQNFPLVVVFEHVAKWRLKKFN